MATALIRVGKVAVVALGYLGVGWIGLQVHIEASSSITVLWPAAGLAVTALLLWGHRMVVGVFLGATAINGLTAAGWTAAPVIGLGNCAEAMIIVMVLRASVPTFTSGIERIAELLPLVLAAAGGCFVAASVGTGALAGNGLLEPADWLIAWCAWWAGDLLGILVVVPAGLVVYSIRHGGVRFERRVARADEPVPDPDPGAVTIRRGTPAPKEGWPLRLTTREVEVLRLVAQGLTNDAIAERLVISPHTVARHVEHIYSKTHVRNRVDARRIAVKLELVPSAFAPAPSSNPLTTHL